MLAYAPRPDQKKLRPATLGLIILGHVGLLVVVMTAKSGLIPKPDERTVITFFPDPKPLPKPPPPEPKPNPQPATSQIDTLIPTVPLPPSPGPIVDQFPQDIPQPGPSIGTGTLPGPIPTTLDPPIVRKKAYFTTTGEAVRPPYPIAKREAGDEASLLLKLTIDERGRVIAVDPVGRADPTFLEAARRHILRVWRYQPAMEGARAVTSTTTITLKFEIGKA